VNGTCDQCGGEIKSIVTKFGSLIRRYIKMHGKALCPDCAWRADCEVCGDPVGIILPDPQLWIAARAFCGMDCCRKWKAVPVAA
jgi:hypothetical protein